MYPSRTNGEAGVERWPLIEKALQEADQWTSVHDIQHAIMSYNYLYENKWSFGTLQRFFDRGVNEEMRDRYLTRVLPKIASLALCLPQLITQPLPLLCEKSTYSVTLSQEQAACLLANAFFCTFPSRNSNRSLLPAINFNTLFRNGSDRGIQKLRCIFHYFDRIFDTMPKGLVTLHRRCRTVFPDWKASTANIPRLHISCRGTIEDDGLGMLQLDFANKFLGGGVLGHGCVQEEIRFLICPELLISCLLTERLSDNECLVIKGAERFSYYSGYADTFEWIGDYVDDTPRDGWLRRETEIVAIDARLFSSSSWSRQFSPDAVFRELNKAFVGFFGDDEFPEHLPAIATGHWGCGAFGGDKQLKSVLQLMAAGQTGRDVAYFTFNDRVFMHQLHHIHACLLASQTTVGQLCELVSAYGQSEVRETGGHPSISLFDYLLKSVMSPTVPKL